MNKMKDARNSHLRSEISYRELLAAIVDSSDDAIISKSLDGCITSWNHAAEVMYGYTAEEMIGKPIALLHPPDRPDEITEILEKINRGERVEHYETLRQRKDGGIVPVSLSVSPVYDHHGQVTGAASIARDITERNQAEDRTRAAAEYTRSLIEASLDPLVTISPDGKITDVNEATTIVTGVARDALIGTDFSTYFTEPQTAREGYERVFAHGSVTDYPLTIRHRDGHLTEVMYNASVFTDSAGKVTGVFAAARDVAALREAERQAARRAEQLAVSNRELVRSNDELMTSTLALTRTSKVLETITAADATLVRARDQQALFDEMCRIMVVTGGYGLAWIAAPGTADPHSIVSLASYGDRPVVEALVEASPRTPAGPVTEATHTGQIHIVRDIGELPADLPVRGILQEFGYGALAALPIKADHDHFATLTVYSRQPDAFQPGEVRLLESLASDIGYGIGALRLRDDLDTRVRQRTAELEKANEELEAFASSVSHNLRAPLRALSGFSEALTEECADSLGKAGLDYLARIQAASQKMDNLIDGLLNLARVSRAAIHPQRVNLSHEVTEIISGLQRSEPARHVHCTVEGDVRVTADPTLIRSVIQNLLENAWKFTIKRTDARVEFGTAHTTSGVSYYVRDNGAGFDPAYMGKLFQPFERLHSSTDFPGTGIGLASARKIIERHGGQMWAESQPDAGATFYFTLALA